MARRESLLIVDDERLLSASLRRHFSALGVDVTLAGSVAEGRDRLGSKCFDACLLDIGLPDGDGLSLVDSLPIDRSIVITAVPDRARLAAAGIRRVIPKPFDLDVVTDALCALGLGVPRRSPERHGCGGVSGTG